LRALQSLCEEEVGIEDATIREEIAQLKRKHTALWQMNVFLDPDCRDRQRDLSAQCQNMFYNIPNCNPAYIETPIQSIRERLLLQAITKDPDGESLDLPACNRLITAGGSGEKEAWTVDEVRKILPRKSPPLSTESPDLHPAKRTFRDLPRTRRDAKRWLRDEAEALLPQVRSRFTRDLEPVLDFLFKELEEESNRQEALMDLHARLRNEGTKLFNNFKTAQVVKSLRRKWKPERQTKTEASTRED
jgi:hypothetical protein